MRNQVRKYVFAVSLVGLLSTTVPAMAVARDGSASRDVFARIRNAIIRLLDIVEIKGMLPPG
jgi:hypothetical protein